MCLVAHSFCNKHFPGTRLSVSYPSGPWEHRGAQVQSGYRREVVAIGCESCLGAPTQGSLNRKDSCQVGERPAQACGGVLLELRSEE